MKDTKDLIIRVIDSESGLFLPVAQRMARDAKLVEYWTPAWETMPTVKRCTVGDGFPDIERIDYAFSKKNRPDLFVFPDIGFAEMQRDVIEQGYPVWGSANGDELEISRGKFLKVLSQIGLEIPPHKVIDGIPALTAHLREQKDKWIKISKYRGDWETLHWRSWDEDWPELYRRAIKLGPAGDQILFYVFDTIDAVVEDGIDTFCILGDWPKTCMHGIERKDEGYLCTVAGFASLPEEILHVNEAVTPVLKSYGYCGDFSTEIRITEDGHRYWIDPTCRKGSPPSQIQTEMFSNYTQYHWAGANGEVLDPEPTDEFGLQLAVKSKSDSEVWTVIELPRELNQWFKCPGASMMDGRICLAPCPDEEDRTVGWLCATGPSIKKVAESMKEKIDLLPDGLYVDKYCMSELIKDVINAEENDMEFTTQTVPEPTSVLK